jgi:hypothetical protein
MSAIAVRFDGYRSLAFGSVGATYTALGTPTTHLMRILKIVNNTNADLNISFDGTTNNDFVPANSFVLYDFETNSSTDYDFFLALSTQLYVNYNTGAPTSGSVYAVMVYGKGQ